MIFGTVINPELRWIVVTVIATGFDDKPTSHGRKSGSTGFGTSVNTSTAMQLMNHSLGISSNAQATDSVSERTHTTKENDIPSFIIEKCKEEAFQEDKTLIG